jgi:RHS repeat-associated protein
MTDSDQAVAKSYDYSAFGKIISEAGTVQNPFTYTAREYDSDSGLYYYRARYYDAGVGRFLSRDPLAGTPLGSIALEGNPAFSKNTKLGDALFLRYVGADQLYKYVLNDPINLLDPTGTSGCDFTCGLVSTVVCGVISTGCSVVCAPTLAGILVCGIKCAIDCYIAAYLVCGWICKEDCP